MNKEARPTLGLLTRNDPNVALAKLLDIHEI